MAPEAFTARFTAYAAELQSPSFLADVAARADLTVDWLETKLPTMVAEASHTIRVVESELDRTKRVLEVGAGLGVTSAFLAREGIDITSLEPGGIGYEAYARTNPAIRAALGVDHPHHEMLVEDVDLDRPGGRFDLIFSNNVLEHVLDVGTALARLDALLAPGGVMVHNCPNYTAPYEPHFGIPLVPVRPALTAKLLPARISDSGLWKSLNFVTAREVESVAADLGATVEFRPAMLAEAVERLGEDDFRQRHPGLARVATPLRWSAVVLRRLPASVTTPMVFRWSRPAAG